MGSPVRQLASGNFGPSLIRVTKSVKMKRLRPKLLKRRHSQWNFVLMISTKFHIRMGSGKRRSFIGRNCCAVQCSDSRFGAILLSPGGATASLHVIEFWESYLIRGVVGEVTCGWDGLPMGDSYLVDSKVVTTHATFIFPWFFTY